MSYWRVLPLCALALVASAQSSFGPGVNPADPMERVTGQVSATDEVGRATAIDLLQRARDQYQLRHAGRAFDLKVTFTVKSDGQTEHDGVWTMEDVFEPRFGLRW